MLPINQDIQLASGMNKQMENFREAAYSKEELSSALYLLKEEKTVPRAALEESHVAKEDCDQELIDFNLE